MATQIHAPARPVALTIHGVGYGVATRYIEQELLRVPGVARVQMTPGGAHARALVEGAASPETLRAAVQRLGFRVDLS